MRCGAYLAGWVQIARQPSGRESEPKYGLKMGERSKGNAALLDVAGTPNPLTQVFSSVTLHSTAFVEFSLVLVLARSPRKAVNPERNVCSSRRRIQLLPKSTQCPPTHHHCERAPQGNERRFSFASYLVIHPV